MGERPYILTVDIASDGNASATIDGDTIESSRKKAVYFINRDMVERIIAMLYAAVRDRNMKEAEDMGKALAALVLPKEIRDQLPKDGEALLLSTNEHSIPWELLWDRTFYGIRYAIGRQLLTTGDIKTPLPSEPKHKRTSLILANPTGDLPEAQHEAVELLRFLRAKEVFCTLLTGDQITSPDILVCLGNGNLDFIHYSGHIEVGHDGAYLRLAGEDRFYLREVLHLDGFGRPFLFLNGCGGGAVWGGSEAIVMPLILAGSGPILCAALPISDKGGREFSECIMNDVLKGVPYGRATMEARKKFCFDPKASMDWMSFVFYGNPTIGITRDYTDAFLSVLGRADGLTDDVYVISTSHLFVSLLMENDTDIIDAFKKLNVRPGIVEAIISELFDAPMAPEIRDVPDKSRYSPNALEALNKAVGMAMRKRREVAPRDLFIALLSSPNTVTQLLEGMDIDYKLLLEYVGG